MTTLALSAGRLAAALVLVLLNGFFVAAEFAYVRIRSTAVEALVDEGKPGAELLDEALDNLDDYLAVTQLGITISSLGLGWIGEPAVAALIEPVLEPLVGPDLIHLIAFALGFSVITFLHVVFGELAPKTIAIAQAERVSLFVAPPMQFFYYVFRPGIYVFNGTANYFTRLIGVPPASETDETLTEEEILTVLTRSGTKGHIDSEEVEMIEQIFDLDDLSVREIMIPRPDVVSVPADLSLGPSFGRPSSRRAIPGIRSSRPTSLTRSSASSTSRTCFAPRSSMPSAPSRSRRAVSPAKCRSSPRPAISPTYWRSSSVSSDRWPPSSTNGEP